MTVKIGINGFGRIGRLAFRRIFELQARGGQAESFWDYTKGVGIRVGRVREKV